MRLTFAWFVAVVNPLTAHDPPCSEQAVLSTVRWLSCVAAYPVCRIVGTPRDLNITTRMEGGSAYALRMSASSAIASSSCHRTPQTCTGADPSRVCRADRYLQRARARSSTNIPIHRRTLPVDDPLCCPFDETFTSTWIPRTVGMY